MWLEAATRLVEGVAHNPAVIGVGGVALVQWLTGQQYKRRTGMWHLERRDLPDGGFELIEVWDTELTPIIADPAGVALQAALISYAVLSAFQGITLPQAVAAGKVVGETVGKAVGSVSTALGLLGA